jgi:hypothetical protein
MMSQLKMFTTYLLYYFLFDFPILCRMQPPIDHDAVLKIKEVLQHRSGHTIDSPAQVVLGALEEIASGKFFY